MADRPARQRALVPRRPASRAAGARGPGRRSRPLAWAAAGLGAAYAAVLAIAGGHVLPHPAWSWAIAHTALLAAAAVAHGAARRASARARASERRERAERERAEAAEGALAQERRDVAALARVSRAVSTAPDARAAVVAAACELTGAAFAVLVEPAGERVLELTRAAGVELPAERRIVLGGEPSGAAVAYVSAKPYFVADPASTPAISRRLHDQLRPGSILFQPALLDGRVWAVLVLGWRERVAGLGSREAVLAGILADDAALAVERAERIRAIERAAATDALTGVANRRGWDAALDACGRGGADGAGVCVALIDLDGFKALNDSRGHQAGDRTLKECAAAWRSVLRPEDVLARIGGDEFGVLLVDCDAASAEAVRQRIEAVTPHEAGCSVGLALREPGEDARATVRRADRDLYVRKAERSQARLHDPDRLAALAATGLLDAAEDPVLGRLTRLAQRLLGVPVALVSLVGADRQFFASQRGLDGERAALRGTGLERSFCKYAAMTGRPLVIEDARVDPLVRDSPAVTEDGVVAYAGVPLTLASGHCLGAFCAIDERPRAWTDDDVETLSDLATAAVAELERRARSATGEGGAPTGGVRR